MIFDNRKQTKSKYTKETNFSLFFQRIESLNKNERRTNFGLKNYDGIERFMKCTYGNIKV